MADSHEIQRIADSLKGIKKHKVKVINEDPWIVETPESMLDCDTWTLKKNQRKCRRGHPIIYEL